MTASSAARSDLGGWPSFPLKNNLVFELHELGTRKHKKTGLHQCQSEKSDYMFGYDRNPEVNTPHAPQRLLQLMKIQVADTRMRIRDLDNIRAKNDDSYEYQTGYVMAEIIEKYRLMMEFHQRPQRFGSDELFETLKRTELVQTLYIEVWHLCMMLHEIHRKTVVKSGLSYVSEDESELSGIQAVDQQAIKDLEELRKLQKKLERQRRKERRLVSYLYHKYFNKKGVRTGWGRNFTAKSFELNYGWDLAYRPGHGPKLVFSTRHRVTTPDGGAWYNPLTWLG